MIKIMNLIFLSFFSIFLITPHTCPRFHHLFSLSELKNGETSSEALSELQLVYFILGRMSNKISKSVCWGNKTERWDHLSKRQKINNKCIFRRKYGFLGVQPRWYFIIKWSDMDFSLFLSWSLCSTWHVFTRGFALVLHRESCPCLLMEWLLDWIWI